MIILAINGNSQPALITDHEGKSPIKISCLFLKTRLMPIVTNFILLRLVSCNLRVEAIQLHLVKFHDLLQRYLE